MMYEKLDSGCQSGSQGFPGVKKVLHIIGKIVAKISEKGSGSEKKSEVLTVSLCLVHT